MPLRRFVLPLLLSTAPVLAQPAPSAHPVHPAPVVSPPAHGAARPPSHRAGAAHSARPGPAKPAPAPAPAPAPQAEKPPEPSKGTATGLPLPRFVSLRGDTVNFRAGPGRQYPIEWVYQRRDLPVEIEREFENWRLVEDQEGVKGWVHQATLTSRRTVVITGGERILRSDARDDSSAVARLKPGVVIRLRACAAAADWCQASVQDYRGWIRRTEVWGMLPREEVQ